LEQKWFGWPQSSRFGTLNQPNCLLKRNFSLSKWMESFSLIDCDFWVILLTLTNTNYPYNWFLTIPFPDLLTFFILLYLFHIICLCFLPANLSVSPLQPSTNTPLIPPYASMAFCSSNFHRPTLRPQSLMASTNHHEVSPCVRNETKFGRKKTINCRRTQASEIKRSERYLLSTCYHKISSKLSHLLMD